MQTCVLVAALAFALRGFVAHGQTAQFLFDDNGNLTVQTTAVLALPEIIGQPQNQIVPPDGTASFSVTVADPRGISYQWRRNGAPLGGVDQDSLTVMNLNTNKEGFYQVVLTNPSGSVTSAPAFLILDSDDDGMGDAWEISHFGNLVHIGSGDSDGDGSSDRQEFEDGTEPTDPTSVLYHLTVLLDGGAVVKAPDQSTYTNGEPVTLTASSLPGEEPFHAWTGDVLTRSNSISLVMTNNKTVYAHFAPILFFWTNHLGGDWNIAANWTPNLVPDTNDSVFIDAKSGTVTLNTAAECADVTLGDPTGSPIIPTLTGTGTLSVRDSFLWLSGRMSGGGATVLKTGATMEIANAGNVVLESRTLDNSGTVLWYGTGSLILNNSVVTNQPGALFHAQNVATISGSSGTRRFDNAGTFRKSAGTTTVPSGLAFNNSGLVEIQSGTLTLLGGGTHRGSFSVAGGATLVLSGTHTADMNSAFTGAGGLTVSGGTAALAGLVNVSGSNTFSFGTANLTGNYICANNTLTISGGTANINGTGLVSPAVINLTSGTLSGSNTVTVGNAMTWTAGTMSGTGRTIIAPSATLQVNSGTAVSLQRTLENGGTTVWSGTGGFVLINGVITNRTGALFEVQNAVAFSSSGRFDNAGTFRKSVSSGTTTLPGGMSFNNSGTVEVQTGTLALSGGGTHSGGFFLAGNSALILSGTHTGDANSAFTGAGTLTVSGGTANLAGLVNVSGSNVFSGGTANLNGNYTCTNNTLTVSGAATANFNGVGTVAPAHLGLLRVGNPNPTMGGSNTVSVLGQMDWTGGTMNGSGRTIIQPGATLILTNLSTAVLNRTLENGGTVLWTGAGDLSLNNGTFTNRVGGVVEVRNAAALQFGGGSSRVNNAGMFRKSVNAGTTSVGVTFNNYGTVDIRSGILAANGGYVSSSNALLSCALGGTNAGTGYGQLQKSGSIALAGKLSVDLLPGFTPDLGDTFTVVTAGTRGGTFSDFSYPANRVTLQMSNTPTSVILTTTDVFPVPQPVLLTPEIVGSKALFTWTATSNVTYRLEENAELGSTNWTAVSGDVTTLSNTATKLDPLTSSNRLYRVRVLP